MTISFPSVVVCSVVVAAVYLLYRWALPKPIPGIPYHKHSAKRLMGDAPDLIKHVQDNDTVFDWMSLQLEQLNSPIVQLFTRPLGTPRVVISDYREGQDILMRRFTEFDRSDIFADMLIGTIPNHSILRQTDAQYKRQSRLLADTMGSKFLHTIAGPQLYESVEQLIELWAVKSSLAKGHSFEAADDVNHMALDTIWRIAFGTQIDTVKTQTEFLSKISYIDLPADIDDAAVFPEPDLPARFYAIIHLVDAMTVTAPNVYPTLSYRTDLITDLRQVTHTSSPALVDKADRILQKVQIPQGSNDSRELSGSEPAIAKRRGIW